MWSLRLIHTRVREERKRKCVRERNVEFVKEIQEKFVTHIHASERERNAELKFVKLVRICSS